VDKEQWKLKVEDAKEIAQEFEEPYRSITFRVLLERFLGNSFVGLTVEEVHGKVASSPVSMPLTEYLAKTSIKSHNDRVTAIVCHGFKYGTPSMTRQEIMDAYVKARTPRPKNLSDVISQCVRKGNLVDAPEPKDGQKAWQITMTGEKYIDELQRSVAV